MSEQPEQFRETTGEAEGLEGSDSIRCADNDKVYLRPQIRALAPLCRSR